MNIRISAIALACLVGMAVSADPRMEQGARFEAKGEFEMALGEYRAILAENPKSAEAYFAAAQVRMKMRDYSGALANFRLAYKFEPTMSAAYEGAAKVYEALGQKAKADAERAKDPKNNPVAETPAEAPAAVAETPKAEPVPAAPVAETPKAQTAPEAKPVEAAKPEPKPVEAAKMEKPAEPAKVEPAKTEIKAAEPAKVETAVEPAKTETALPTDPFEKGKALFAEGKFKEAAPLWREVLRKQPGHAGAYFYAGLTRYELGEMDKAEFNLKKGLEYKEEGNDANFFLAKIAQKSNKSDQELKFLAAYMKKAAPNAKYRAAAEARIAEIKAEKESKNQPAATPSTETVAKVETKSESKTVESAPAKAVEEAPVVESKVADIADAPSGAPTLANANLLYSAGSIESAVKMYKALLETEQQPEERYFTMLQLGNAYRELRDFHSAVVRYREVVQQFPDSDWAAEAERALEDAVWLEKHASELPRRTR